MTEPLLRDVDAFLRLPPMTAAQRTAAAHSAFRPRGSRTPLNLTRRAYQVPLGRDASNDLHAAEPEQGRGTLTHMAGNLIERGYNALGYTPRDSSRHAQVWEDNSYLLNPLSWADMAGTSYERFREHPSIRGGAETALNAAGAFPVLGKGAALAGSALMGRLAVSRAAPAVDRLAAGQIDRLLASHAATPGTRSYVTHMSPDDFLGLSASREGREQLTRNARPLDIEELQGLDPPSLTVHHGGEPSDWQRFQGVRSPNMVFGHDGRNRMTALREAGHQRVPVVVHVKGEPGDGVLPGMQVRPQHGRLSPLNNGDTPADLGRMVPISEANREALAAGPHVPEAPIPLEGAPQTVRVNGVLRDVGPNAPAHESAQLHANRSGIPLNSPSSYVTADPERGRRLAAAYDEMPHAPNDPEVQAAYGALSRETLAQYEAAKAGGMRFGFHEPGADPYGNPWNALSDVRDNNHLSVFPTDAGYGAGGITDEMVAENPMLALVPGETWNGKPVRVNDVFRGVHDYYGHAKEGVGFRASGEENAFRSHAGMFSPEARRALTTETRGQNSWVNFGPHGEANRTASGAGTTYADQKIGLMPEWATYHGNEDFLTHPSQMDGAAGMSDALSGERPNGDAWTEPFTSRSTEGVEARIAQMEAQGHPILGMNAPSAPPAALSSQAQRAERRAAERNEDPAATARNQAFAEHAAAEGGTPQDAARAYFTGQDADLRAHLRDRTNEIHQAAIVGGPPPALRRMASTTVKAEVQAANQQPVAPEPTIPWGEGRGEGGSDRIQVGGTTLDYDANPNRIDVRELWTPPEERGQGNAKSAMASLLQEADRRGTPVRLMSSPMDDETEARRLERFYRNMGFKRTGEFDDGDPILQRLPRAAHKGALSSTQINGALTANRR